MTTLRRGARRLWTIPSGALALTVLLNGCGPAANDPAQGGVTAREAQALNEAAVMLDDNGQDAIVVTNETDPPSTTDNRQ